MAVSVSMRGFNLQLEVRVRCDFSPGGKIAERMEVILPAQEMG